MKKDIIKLKILDLVYSSQKHGGIQIRNDEQLQIVERLWDDQFFGIDLSEELVTWVWPDFRQRYHSEYIKKFVFIDDDDNSKILFSFYAVYSSKDVNPMVKASLLDEDLFEDEDGFLQDIPESTVFRKCYCFQKSKKVYFKYLHELQSLLDNCKIGRVIYGNMSYHLGAKSDLEEI